MEKLEALKIIGDIFRDNKIPFALIGAYAASAWGVVRATRDIDILIEIKKEEIERISSELRKKSFQAEIRFGDPEDPLVGVIKLNFKTKEGDESIDLILGIKKLPKNIFQRTINLTIFEQIIPVVSPEDLVLMKLLAGSPLDIQDAQGIIDVLKEKIDLDYLSIMSRKLRLNLRKLKIEISQSALCTKSYWQSPCGRSKNSSV